MTKVGETRTSRKVFNASPNPKPTIMTDQDRNSAQTRKVFYAFVAPNQPKPTIEIRLSGPSPQAHNFINP